MAPFTLLATVLLGLSAQVLAGVMEPRENTEIIAPFETFVVDKSNITTFFNSSDANRVPKAVVGGGDLRLMDDSNRDKVDCMLPDHRGSGDYAECRALCTALYNTPYSVHVPPDTTRYFYNRGNCKMAIRNPRNCDDLDVDYKIVGEMCHWMNKLCMVNGYDGYFWGKNKIWEGTLTGQWAPPPYTSIRC